jgi:hypothetical protein
MIIDDYTLLSFEARGSFERAERVGKVTQQPHTYECVMCRSRKTDMQVWQSLLRKVHNFYNR